MPTDQRIRFDVRQHIAPREHSTQSCHRPPRGIICPSRFNLPLLKESQLLPKEQILGCKCPTRASSDNQKTSEIEQDEHRSNETVPQSGEQQKRRKHEGSGSHVR